MKGGNRNVFFFTFSSYTAKVVAALKDLLCQKIHEESTLLTLGNKVFLSF
jgi:phosphoribosyl-ATP pyrophosphohydrolase